jgi:hypothetical protein
MQVRQDAKERFFLNVSRLSQEQKNLLQNHGDGMKTRDMGFWVLQVPGLFLLMYLIYAQAIPAFDSISKGKIKKCLL